MSVNGPLRHLMRRSDMSGVGGKPTLCRHGERVAFGPVADIGGLEFLLRNNRVSLYSARRNFRISLRLVRIDAVRPLVSQLLLAPWSA